MHRITNAQIDIHPNGALTITVPGEQPQHFQATLPAHAIAADLGMAAQRARYAVPSGVGQVSGKVYHHAGNQPAQHIAFNGPVAPAGSVAQIDPITGRISAIIPPPGQPASNAPKQGMTEEEFLAKVDQAKRNQAAHATPCGWCGFTTGHAPSCAFVPRDRQDQR